MGNNRWGGFGSGVQPTPCMLALWKIKGRAVIGDGAPSDARPRSLGSRSGFMPQRQANSKTSPTR